MSLPKKKFETKDINDSSSDNYILTVYHLENINFKTKIYFALSHMECILKKYLKINVFQKKISSYCLKT